MPLPLPSETAAAPDPAAELLAQVEHLPPAAVAGALGSLPPGAASATLRRYARAAGADAYPFLAGVLEQGGPPHVLAAAAEALGEVPTQPAADLAHRWSAADVAREPRKAARRAALRLAQRGLRPSPAALAATEPAPPARPERVRRALMSAVDGAGTRALYLLVDLPLAGGHQAILVVSEREGVQHFYMRPSTGRQFERAVADDQRQLELPLAEIPPAYARRLIADAVAAAHARGAGLPPQFSAFHAALGPPADEAGEESAAAEVRPPIYDDLEAAAVRYRPDLVEGSMALLSRPEFAGWLPEPEDVAPIAKEWLAVERGPIALPPSAVAQRQDAIFDRLIERVLGPGGAAGFRRRLEDNAFVLLKRGQAQPAREALAAAVALEPPDVAAARRHPLVRGLAQEALERALEAERTGTAHPLDEAAAAGPARVEARPSGLIVARSLPSRSGMLTEE